jgi:hypothetical protein
MYVTAHRSLSRITRRVPAAQHFFLTNRDDHGAVQVQCGNGCAASGRRTFDSGPLPPKMFAPNLGARIEERDLLRSFWIDRRLMRPFAQ